MKPGDLVQIMYKGDAELNGVIGVILDYVDENLRSGRMCYAKIMLPNLSVRYISPESLTVLSETDANLQESAVNSRRETW
jgi:hypothetical protein